LPSFRDSSWKLCILCDRLWLCLYLVVTEEPAGILITVWLCWYHLWFRSQYDVWPTRGYDESSECC